MGSLVVVLDRQNLHYCNAGKRGGWLFQYAWAGESMASSALVTAARQPPHHARVAGICFRCRVLIYSVR